MPFFIYFTNTVMLILIVIPSYPSIYWSGAMSFSKQLLQQINDLTILITTTVCSLTIFIDVIFIFFYIVCNIDHIWWFKLVLYLQDSNVIEEVINLWMTLLSLLKSALEQSVLLSLFIITMIKVKSLKVQILLKSFRIMYTTLY